MRSQGLLLTLLLCRGASTAPVEALPKPPTFAFLQAWAGPDAVGLGFTEDRITAFLHARKADLSAARQPEWSAWLKHLAQAKGPSLRAWVHARRIEAGDYTDFPAFQDALAAHLLGISKAKSGRSDQVLTNPPDLNQLSLPETCRIDHDSPFWRSLRKTLQAKPDRKLDAGLYAVWCYGTHPDQRDLILELAAQVQTPSSVKNLDADPWNDPRFWIVTDWAIAWGQPVDFEAIQAALPDGLARIAFQRIYHRLEAIPRAFLEPPLTGPPPTPAMPKAQVPSIPDPPPGGLVDLHFSQIKVIDQPPPPRYPQEAKSRRLMTHLVLTLVVDPTGKPVSCRPEPGPWLAFFAPTGMEYGMRWTFRPATWNGVPQYSRFRLTMPFRLGM